MVSLVLKFGFVNNNKIMLEPKKIKYRRHHRGNRRGMASRGSHVAFGTYGLKALEPGWVTARQIESSRIVISRIVRKIGKMWIRIFPDKPITAKPAETRMGKGKGSPEYWICRVKPGRIMFELDGVSELAAKEALSLAAAKLPMHTKVVKRLGE